MQYDLIIVGAGVAAASALISLKKSGLRIAVIAPENSLKFKIGETLGPAGLLELEALGLSEELVSPDHWPAFQKFSSWGTSQLMPSNSAGHQSWYLDRIKFEGTLWSRARQTDFQQVSAKVTQAEPQNGSWQVKTKDQEFITKFVLDASGRSSVVGRHHVDRTRHDKLVALFTVLTQSDEEIEPTRATLIEALSQGWLYSVLIPGNKMVVSWFTDSDLLAKGHVGQKEHFLKQVHQSESTLKRIESAGFQLNNDIHITDASTITTDKLSTDNLILTGDAAICFDPLSSHGITTALWSGRKSGKAIHALFHGDDSLLTSYAEAVRKGTEKYLLEKQMIYRAETRFTHEIFWQRRS